MTQLETPRLVLRVCQSEDADEVFAVERESLDELRRWFWWCHPEHTRQRSKAWAASRVDAWRKGEEFSFLITDRNDRRMLGCVWLSAIDAVARRANLGYWLRTGCAESGLATEASREMLRWAFDQLGLERIQIVMAVENEGSQRLAERLGARREGVVPGRIHVNGREQDAYVYSLRRDQC